MHLRTPILAVLAAATALAVAAPVLACGEEPHPQNLLASPALKAGLRAAFLRANSHLTPAQVGLPLAGRTYYGTAYEMKYAVATFAASGKPTIFGLSGEHGWRVIRQTHGGVCEEYVPVELIQAWALEHWGGSCYVLPSRA